jgi:preprotein translocase subunit SecE
MNPGEKIKDWTERTKQFYADVRSEMRKVTWPSRQEVIGTTGIVIAAVLFFGAYLGIVDVILSAGVQRLLTYFRVAGGS